MRNLAFLSLACTVGGIVKAWDDAGVKALVSLAAGGCALLIFIKMNRVEAKEWRESIRGGPS